jgi:hypothetical protein
METEMEASKVGLEPREPARRHSAAACSSRAIGLDGVAADVNADGAVHEPGRTGTSQLFPPQFDSSDEEEGVGGLVRPSRRLTL